MLIGALGAVAGLINAAVAGVNGWLTAVNVIAGALGAAFGAWFLAPFWRARNARAFLIVIDVVGAAAGAALALAIVTVTQAG